MRDEGLPVKRAARDRFDNRVSIDRTKTSQEPLVSRIEEVKLIKHLKDLASDGYGYKRAEVVSMTTDNAIYLWKK